jgi:potassium-transporting ATPase KdpC subunit
MRTYFASSVKLTIVLVLLLGILYPLAIRMIAYTSPGRGNGVTREYNGRKVGYALIGQKFTGDAWFQGRPSAVNYNAAGSGGSNKSIYNPEYIKVMQARLDTFLLHNPAVKKEDVPVELITASGSGLDPDITPGSAIIQVPRIARARSIPANKILSLIRDHTTPPLLGIFGPERINVLELNIALANLR